MILLKVVCCHRLTNASEVILDHCLPELSSFAGRRMIFHPLDHAVHHIGHIGLLVYSITCEYVIFLLLHISLHTYRAVTSFSNIAAPTHAASSRTRHPDFAPCLQAGCCLVSLLPFAAPAPSRI